MLSDIQGWRGRQLNVQSSTVRWSTGVVASVFTTGGLSSKPAAVTLECRLPY